MAKDVIRIAYVIDTIATPGAGTEKQLLILLNGIDRRKFEPFLICLHDSEWLKSRAFSFPVIKFDTNKIVSYSFLNTLYGFVKLCRREQFNIVQTFFFDAGVLGAIGARLSGCKTIISSRRNAGYWHNKKFLLSLRLLRYWTTRYLSNSKSVARTTAEVEGIDPTKIEVIYNGLDLKLFEPITDSVRAEQRDEWNIADDEILIGAVANLRPVKNIESFISAAASLMRKFNHLKFVVVGEGPLRDELRGLIAHLGLTERFNLVGAQTDIPGCLQAFDLAVLCSKSESFSNSLIEYMAAGLPIVASDVGGNGEAISHNDTGLLYSLDDENGLAKMLEEMLRDWARALKLGENAKVKAFKEYGLERAIRKHEEYYMDTLKT